MTKFQEEVYNIVKKIPKGEVITYKEVAERIDNPKAFRAVGNALNKNKFVGVPCHRVIKSNGDVGGYAWGTKNKSKLLKQEGWLTG